MKIGYAVNWFVTRRCNLHCSYCSVVNAKEFEKVYKTKEPFLKDVDIDKAEEFIRRLKLHNPDAFHMFLGGEPTVYKHLEELVEFCNKNDVLYTVITNMTDFSYNRLKEILDNVGYLNGLSFTIDPIIFDPNADKNDDRYKKSLSAFEKFLSFRDDKRIREFVAIVGVDSSNIRYLHSICKHLANHKVWIDLILLETKLNKYYDFQAPLDYDLLVWNTDENISILNEVYQKAESGEYPVLFHKVIRYRMIPNLPQKYICTIDRDLSTLSIDSDFKLRLCLRIRGLATSKFEPLDLLDENGNLNTTYFIYIKEAMKLDKKNFCYGCQWTCPMATDLIMKGIITPQDLNHDKIQL